MVARKSDQSSIKPRILSITFRTFCIKYPSLKIPEREGYGNPSLMVGPLRKD